MADNNPTTETVRHLVALVVEHGLAELTVEEDGIVITVKGAAAASSVALPAAGALVAASISAPAAMPTPNTSTPAKAARSASLVAIESPMVGLFYHSPSPDDPAYVQVGDPVRIGQTIGLIEAMKVYSEVPAEVAGRIVEIVTANGVLVQQGQPLFYVEPV